jgi:DNA mismatch repair protein MutS
VLVRELESEIIFLHKIAPGSAERSYGIHVARLAGVPESVLKRATSVLETLEKQHELPSAVASAPQATAEKKGPVQPPEAPRRRPKLKPQISGPSLFGDGEDVPF